MGPFNESGPYDEAESQTDGPALVSLEDLVGTGILVKTGPFTWTTRTITGTASRISVTNGDGIAGSPIIDISSSYVGQTSITTLGTIATGTWNASTIGVTKGGTGLVSLAQGDTLYASATNTLTALTKDANATRYLSNTGALNNPAWSQVSLTDGVSGTLPIGKGGSGLALVGAANQLLGTDAAGTGLEYKGVTVSLAGVTVIPAALTLQSTLTLGGIVSGAGNQINNVIIGTSTPLAGAFTTLSATGALSAIGPVTFGNTLTSLAGVGGIDVQSGNIPGIVVGADANAITRTDATVKRGTIAVPHYLLAEEPTAGMFFVSNVASATLNLGGGNGALNTVTGGNLYAAADTTTLLGTVVATWNIDGFSLRAVKKLFWDGPTSTGDSYTYESSANVVDHFAGGVNTLRLTTTAAAITGNLSATGNVTLGNAAARTFNVDPSATDVVGRDLTIGAGSTVTGTAVNDVVGGTLTIKAGLGTGTGTSNIDLATGTTLGTGKVLQTLSTKLRILGNGDIAVGALAKVFLDGITGAGNSYILESAADTITIVAGGASTLAVNATTITGTGTLGVTGGAWFRNSANATGATTGHQYLVTSAGAPTGIPAAKTGQVAMQYDTTNNFLYVYNGAWKKSTVYA